MRPTREPSARPALNTAKRVCGNCQLPRTLIAASRGAGFCLCWGPADEMARWVNYLREALGLEPMHRVENRHRAARGVPGSP